MARGGHGPDFSLSKSWSGIEFSTAACLPFRCAHQSTPSSHRDRAWLHALAARRARGGSPVRAGRHCMHVVASVTITGMVCASQFNAQYHRQESMLNGRVHYSTSDGRLFLYWSASHAPGWLISSDENDAGSYAVLTPTDSTEADRRHTLCLCQPSCSNRNRCSSNQLMLKLTIR
eukprot:COSAG02_NODE_3873_length_6113_cov_1129.365813_4_plen_174_part_01